MRRWGVVLAATLGTMGFATKAEANQGRPYPRERVEVDGGVEPRGMPDIAIRREVLRMDFRPLEEFGAPEVEATYELDNRGAEQSVPLVFASFDVEDGRVSFDGAALDSRPLAADELPSAWATPEGKRESTIGELDGASGLAFEVTIPPGQHELVVRYAIGGDFEEWNATGHMVSYNFEPALSWGGMERLEVEIQCAQGWTCEPGFGLQLEEEEGRSEPPPQPLEFDETEPGTFVGTAPTLPTRPLDVVLQRPPPWWVANGLTVLGWLAPFVFVGGILAGARLVAVPRAVALRVVVWVGLSAVAAGGSCAYGLEAGSLSGRQDTMMGGYGGVAYLLGSAVAGGLVIVGIGVLGLIWSRVIAKRRA